MTVVTILINTPSKESPDWVKKCEALASTLVATNRISAITTQKEKAFLIVHNFNNDRKIIQRKSQNTGLDTEKLNLANSFKYAENFSPNICQSILIIPIGNPGRERLKTVPYL